MGHLGVLVSARQMDRLLFASVIWPVHVIPPQILLTLAQKAKMICHLGMRYELLSSIPIYSICHQFDIIFELG